MNRRDFLWRVGGTILAAEVGQRGDAFAEAAARPTLYYIDGYHGGARGHMPAGCWRDILEEMRARPDWKLSLDVEAPSWEILKQEDPLAYEELRDYVRHVRGGRRVEVVGGTFAQPYGWALTGESNIRQLEHGLELIRAHFGEACVETYAVQEPCWASCLPQILRSFGFTGASLKNASTAWGGYTQGIDAELVNWIGPDGTAIAAVPRYACEELRAVYETEANLSTSAYIKKCVEHGIREPVGMCFQDLGWTAKPRVSADYIRYATWSEYIHSVASTTPKDWRFTMEDILVTLPWGEKTLHALARQVRSAETRLVLAEKMASLAWLTRAHVWPRQRLYEAWEQTLWAQAHDAWITATTRTGRQAWAFQVAAETLEAEEAAQAVIAESAVAMSANGMARIEHPMRGQAVRVFNCEASDREDVVEIVVAADRGTQGFTVLTSDGAEVPSQIAVTRRYPTQERAELLSKQGEVGLGDDVAESDGINEATVLFCAKAPAFGFTTYRVMPHYDHAQTEWHEGVVVRQETDGSVMVESDFYRVRMDASVGGAITSLFQKKLNQELCPKESAYRFNEYRGYFIVEERWRSSTEKPAQLRVMESGPVRAKVEARGEVGGCAFRTILTVTQGQPRIDFDVTFQFNQDTWIGDPWDIKPEDRMKERRRSQNDGRWKLQAVFPTALERGAIYKNAAYDVCKSRNESTYFQRWDEIKHNIIVNWVDLYDDGQDRGLALFSDRTTAYTHGPDHPLALVLGWGWEGGFWWGKCPLRGEQQSHYSLVPHAGRWNEAQLWHESARADEPLVAQLLEGSDIGGAHEASLVRVTPESVCASAVRATDGHLEMRLFNADEHACDAVVEFGVPVKTVESIELDGRIKEGLHVARDEKGAQRVMVAMSQFGLRTLRVAVVNMAGARVRQ